MEQSTYFSAEVGVLESDINALLSTFEQALTVSSGLPPDLRKHFRGRLEEVSEICSDFGYRIGDHMESVLQQQQDLIRPD